uniref:cilia- and flagella-associated protein 77 n=1 Tax=Centroberyx gerrardi TaxID=166262 RepID=UPI003AAF3582
MSSPRVGVVRDSMLTNPLLIRASLGVSRSRGLSRPPADFTYGNSSSVRDGGVAEVLSGWSVQSGSSAPRRSVFLDFVSLNRDGVKSGLVTAKELSQYRAGRAGAGEGPAPRPRPPQAPPRRPARPAVPDITFGITTRPSSPLSDLLSHQFARRWLEEQQLRSSTGDQQQRQSKPGCIPDTRTSLLRRSRALPHTHTLFKLPRFTQVAPALDSFRNQEDRLRSFRSHRSDCVSRRGAQGLGTFSLD